MRLSNFLEECDLPNDEMNKIFYTKDNVPATFYRCFQEGGIKRFSNYLEVPIKFLRGTSFDSPKFKNGLEEIDEEMQRAAFVR